MTIALCDLCGGRGEVGYENPVTGYAMFMDCPVCLGPAELQHWPDVGMNLCQICGRPTDTPPECLACELRADHVFARGQDR